MKAAFSLIFFPLMVFTPWFVAFGENNPLINVLILPFNDSTGDARYASLAEGFQELVSASLSHQERVTVVERDSLTRALNELGLQLKGITKENELHIGKILNVTRIVSGGFLAVNGELVVNVHVVDSSSSQLLGSEQFKGPAEDLSQLVSEMGTYIGKTINSENEGGRAVDLDPVSHLHFMRGLGYFYSGLSRQAISEFMQALIVNPEYAEARLWIGKSYLAENSYRHAQIEFKRFLTDFATSPFANEVQELLKQSREKAEKSGN